MGRIALGLLALTVIAVGALYAFDIRFPISQEEAIQRELRMAATAEELDKRVNDALARDDVDDAEVYSELAAYMGKPLSAETEAKLARAQSTAARIARGTGQFATGFVTGEGTSAAGLAGALTSDVTVVGDVRDIASEGTKLVAGENYSELILGLSVIGIAATAATVATGGGGVVAKAGVSLLKAARRAGTLTAEFAGELTRLVSRAVNTPELARVLRTTNLRDLRATEAAVTQYARGVRQAEIFPVLGRLGDISKTAGPAETVRLMRYVRSTNDLENVSAMSARFGKKTRGVIELTGKTSLRAFKTALNVLEFIIERILAFAAWLLGLLGLSAARRVVRRR
ncbi:MAG: hypothetical protein ACT4OG_03375 [Alphaproteobacteria bacterium]